MVWLESERGLLAPFDKSGAPLAGHEDRIRPGHKHPNRSGPLPAPGT